ncbi:MAG: four helix bundle protein [Anaerolineae bacterium]|nr:four helix bundle protein [Anaerolineae bacterium]
MNSYKELKVWQRTVDLVAEIYRMTRTFPDEERYTLTSQMRRAAISIPSNIAEGWGRGTTKEYVHFLRIARGSLMELETQLIISEKLKYLSADTINLLIKEIQEIGRMLNGLMRSLRHRETGRS